MLNSDSGSQYFYIQILPKGIHFKHLRTILI